MTDYGQVSLSKWFKIVLNQSLSRSEFRWETFKIVVVFPQNRQSITKASAENQCFQDWVQIKVTKIRREKNAKSIVKLMDFMIMSLVSDFRTLLEEISGHVLNILQSGFFWHLNKIVSPVTVL